MSRRHALRLIFFPFVNFLSVSFFLLSVLILSLVGRAGTLGCTNPRKDVVMRSGIRHSPGNADHYIVHTTYHSTYTTYLQTTLGSVSGEVACSCVLASEPPSLLEVNIPALGHPGLSHLQLRRLRVSRLADVRWLASEVSIEGPVPSLALSFSSPCRITRRIISHVRHPRRMLMPILLGWAQILHQQLKSFNLPYKISIETGGRRLQVPPFNNSPSSQSSPGPQLVLASAL